MGGSPAILAVFNAKGGVGKTTTAVNLAVCLAALGRRILLVDMDAQGNATTSFGSPELPEVGTYELITGRADLAAAMRKTAVEDVWLVGATQGLTAIDIELATEPVAHGVLRDIVQRQAGEFDLVIIDCPPAVGAMTLNALVSAHGVIAPANATPFAHDGLVRSWGIIGRIRTALNPALRLVAVQLTLAESAEPDWQDDVTRVIRGEFGDLVLPRAVDHAPEVFVAASCHGVPAVLLAPGSAETEVYLDLAERVVAGEPRLRGAASGSDAAEDAPPTLPRSAARERLQLWHRQLAETGLLRGKGNIPEIHRTEVGEGGAASAWGQRVAMVLCMLAASSGAMI